MNDPCVGASGRGLSNRLVRSNGIQEGWMSKIPFFSRGWARFTTGRESRTNDARSRRRQRVRLDRSGTPFPGPSCRSNQTLGLDLVGRPLPALLLQMHRPVIRAKPSPFVLRLRLPSSSSTRSVLALDCTPYPLASWYRSGRLTVVT